MSKGWRYVAAGFLIGFIVWFPAGLVFDNLCELDNARLEAAK